MKNLSKKFPDQDPQAYKAYNIESVLPCTQIYIHLYSQYNMVALANKTETSMNTTNATVPLYK